MKKQKIIFFGITIVSWLAGFLLWMCFLANLVSDGVINLDVLQKGVHNDNWTLTLDTFLLIYLPGYIVGTFIAGILIDMVKKNGNKKQDQ